ncbi:hypothetical protein YH64_021625 [Achromobacter sp. LC458]|uniref:hypothetical protein n=1 Tax=Achromobacter sp. LC458 TaxID=1120623 RepID=UPI00069AA289|nr:hypothetical protein [Achromobacter sp. LC458]TRM50902.1 hypothetical protein YH64_021625 [Achromobacter sp. LC458]
MFWKIRLFLIAVFFTTFSTASAQTALDQLVSANRQKQLGFDKLSAQQRAEVAKLLLEVYQIGEQAGKKAAQISKPSGAAGAPTSSVIESQIDGQFDGWEGETIVKLMNSQIWQQTEYHYHYHYAFMPKVLIYRSGGGYKMKVEGVEKAVGVERMR